MKTPFILLAAVFCAAVSLYAAEKVNEVKLAKPLIKIGVVLPITGGVSFVGENARDALLLRLKELSASSKFEYKLIIEDDGFEFRRTNAAVQKLKSVDKIDVLITNWAYGSEIALPLLKNSNSKILHLCSDRWTAKEPDYPYDFATGAPLQENLRRFVAALKALGVHRLGLFVNADHGAVAYKNALEECLKNEPNMKIVEPLVFDQSERDFRVWILRLREAKPDRLLCMGSMPAQEIVLRQMSWIKYKVPLCSVNGSWPDVSKDYNEGSWYVQPPPVTGEVARKFEAAYHRPALYPVGHYYDMASILINACEQLPAGKKPTTEAICEKIRETKDFPGLLGNTSYTPPNKLATSVDYYLIQNGISKKVTLEELVNFYKK